MKRNYGKVEKRNKNSMKASSKKEALLEKKRHEESVHTHTNIYIKAKMPLLDSFKR